MNTEQHTDRLPIAGPLIAGPPRPIPAHAAILPDLVAWADQIDGLATSGVSAEDLAGLLIHSRHLQSIARAQQDAILPILNGTGAAIIDAAVNTLFDVADTAADDAAMMAAIRHLRQRSGLATALADLANKADVGTQMNWLSTAADAAIAATVRYLFRQAAARGLVLPDCTGQRGCGWTILALGKLGSSELNYSSDVDLIILHDPDNNALTNPETSQTFFVDLTRHLVSLLSSATRDGIGWRVDLRLRPDPGATAVSIQREAAIGYYESIARTWERAAFIRARPVAGDIEMGSAFLADLQPFIWRRTLDFTVLDDMATMLSRPVASPGWTGFNLKTGRGGIRNIEFFTHVLQLVGGGRSANLRQRSTLDALASLAAEDWISTTQQTTLSAHYHHLRRVEHRLQMMADAQTHALPRSLEDIANFAAFLGHADVQTFLHALQQTLDEVCLHSAHHLFADDAAAGDTAPPLEDEDQMRDWLTAKGFSRPDDISSTLSGWMAGRIATTRSERTRTLLTRMMPDILDQLAMANAPDDCFAAFAGFVEGLPASVQIFSLLDHNRQLGRLLGDILILSPRLATQLRRYPMMFDQVIASNFFSPLDDADAFEATIRSAINDMPVELALDVITRLTRERRFRAEVQALSGVADNVALRLALSDTADAAIRVITSLATADMQRRHGQITGSFAVLGLGRLGVRKMTSTSDIDLVMIWDGSSDARSDGTRSLAAGAYFTRLAQTLVNWLGGATGEGSLYKVDVRLRPDGEKGALAQSCQRLQTYYNDEAWVWEKMALAKARCLTPHTEAGKTAMQIMVTIMAAPPDAAAITTALNQMLTRFRDNYTDAPAWQLRQKPGGIRELDLLVQGLRLQHADLFSHTADPPEAILDTLHAAARMPDELAHALKDAAQLFEALHQALRLIRGTSSDSDDQLSIAAKKFVLTSCDCPDEVTLNTSLEGHRSTVMTALDRLMPPSDGI